MNSLTMMANHQFFECFARMPCNGRRLPSIFPVRSPRIFAIRGVHVDVFERFDGNSRPDVGTVRVENRFHAGHLPWIEPVAAAGRHPGAAVRIWIVRHDRIRSRRHDDRIARARIRIEVQVRRHMGEPVYLEFVTRAQKRKIGFLRIRFRFRVEQGTRSFELRQVSPFVQNHPSALQIFHSVR